MKTSWPFSEILRPAAEATLDGADAPPLVRRAFARHLESRLAAIASRCLFFHFALARIASGGVRRRRGTVHAEWIRRAAKEGIARLLADFPVALEAVATLGQHARAAAGEFADHMETSLQAIGTLGGIRRAPVVRTLRPGLSDPHRCGRTVIAVELDGGRRVFYKPRSLGAERVWGEGLQRLNRRLALPLRPAAVVDVAGGHGWMESIPTESEMTRLEARAFYWRYGAMLCAAWLLDAVDLHRDNFVISGADPVLVDAEGMLHPFAADERRGLARTGMFPHGKNGFDVSGLGPVEPQEAGREMAWRGIGTDGLHCIWRTSRVPAARHLPRVAGRPVPPRAAAREVEEGFAAMAMVARRDRGAVEAWRAEFAATPRRHLRRPTLFYAAVLEALAQPVHLTSRRAWSAALDRLGCAISADERDQLRRWDIPIFLSAPPQRPGVPWSELPRATSEMARWARSAPGIGATQTAARWPRAASRS